MLGRLLMRSFILKRVRLYRVPGQAPRDEKGRGFSQTLDLFLANPGLSNFEAFTVIFGRFPVSAELETFVIAKEAGLVADASARWIMSVGGVRFRTLVLKTESSLCDFTNFLGASEDSGIPNLSRALLEQCSQVGYRSVQWTADGLVDSPGRRAAPDNKASERLGRSMWFLSAQPLRKFVWRRLAGLRTPLLGKIAVNIWFARKRLPLARLARRTLVLPAEGTSFLEPEIPSPVNARMLETLVSEQRLKMVIVVHDLLPISHPRWFSERQAAAHVFLLSLVGRSRRVILATSAVDRLLKDQLRVYGLEGVEIIRSPWPLISGGPTLVPVLPDECENQILVVGGFDQRKNLSSVLSAFQALPADERGSLLVTGLPRPSKPGEMALSALARSIPGVTLTGSPSREALFRLIQGSKAVIYPTLGEGFGLPILETYFLKTRCVVADLTVFRELQKEFPHVERNWSAKRERNAEILGKIFSEPKASWPHPPVDHISGEDWAREILLMAQNP
jgi:glycosyltransferase involved in cell wall biosynthesis